MSKENTGLRELKKQRRRRRIVDVTVALVRERGWENVTVEEIVRRVEISQPTFYNYFSSKDAVLRLVANEALESWTAALPKAPVPESDAAEGLQRFYSKLADVMTADRALWKAIVLSDALNPVRLPEQRGADMVQRGYVESILARGQRRSEITRRFSADRLAENLDALQFLACCAWGADYPPGRSLHAVLKENVDMFLRGAREDLGKVPEAPGTPGLSGSEPAADAKTVKQAKSARRAARATARAGSVCKGPIPTSARPEGTE